MFQVQKTVKTGGGGVSTGDTKWAVGELEWAALMNILDTAVCISKYKIFYCHFLNHRAIVPVTSIVGHSYVSLTSINNYLLKSINFYLLLLFLNHFS
jgi:hypothetical protein